MRYKPAFFTLPAALFLLLLGGGAVRADPYGEDEVKKSTQPIGSSFYRHLAFDFNQDIKKLARYEKRGFGRAEIITLLLLSDITGTPLKTFGKRRLKREITLEDLAKEAGLDYVTLYKSVQTIKKSIEAKGDEHLPPPVFDMKLPKEDEEEENTRSKPDSLDPTDKETP